MSKHRSIGKVDDVRWGDCEACGRPWPCPQARVDYYFSTRKRQAADYLRAVIDKEKPTDGPSMEPLDVIRRTVDDWRAALLTDDELIAAIAAVLDKGEQG